MPMLIHLEKKPPKRRLTEKQRQSIMGLCIALGALLVTLCVVILVRMDRKNDDSILKLADVEDYTQYTEEEFQEIVDNDDYTHLGWFYYNLPPEQQKDIFARFPFLNNENLQKFSYVSEDEVTDNMEVIGKDTYNDTDLLLVREYISPIQTARELYDESYQRYRDAVSEKMENGTYEEFLEEHRKELEDDDSETIYRSPEILYKWWKDDGTTKDVMLPNATDKDLPVLSSGLECDFHINFLRFGTDSNHQLSDYSKDSAGARKFLDDYSNCAGAENNGSYSDSMANKLLGILKQRGMGTKVTIKLSRNERCSDVYDPNKGGDDKSEGATQTDKDGDKGVYITSITIGADAPNDLTISGYDRYLQIPSGKIDGDTNYANIYADKNGVPNKDKDGHYYYTHDVAIIDFCYKVPANYVPSHSNVTCFKYSGARFSTYTYNYAKDMLDDRVIFKKNVGWADKTTLGFLCDSGYQNDINTLSGNINTNTQNLRYGSTQTITKVTNKNKTSADMTQVKYTDGAGENYEKKTEKQSDENKNLDNFTVQINIHENTKQGLGRTEKLNAIRWNPQNDNDRFFRNALSTYGGDMGAVLYITLVQNTETLRFDLGLNGYNTKNKWVDTSNNSNIWDNEIKIDSDNAAHGSKRVLKGTTGSTASVSVFDKYRLVGHKLRYVKVQRSVHPSSDQPGVFKKLPSSDLTARDGYKFSTKNVFSWGMGGFHLCGYLSAGDSNNDNAGIMNEGVWMRTNLARGEDAIDTSYISYPTGNEVKTTYTFMNQNYQLMENSANNDLHFYYNNSTPKVRVIPGAGNGDNTVERAANEGLGPDLINQDDSTQLNNFKTDIGITLNSDRETRLRNLKSTDNKNVAILNYEKDTDGIQTYLLGVKTTNKGNIRGRLGGWMAEAGFAVYDTEDYENSLVGLHGKIPRIGSYKIKRSTPDDIKSKSEGTAADEIVSDRLYEINMAGNLNGDNKFNKYSLTKNNNYQNVDPVEVTLMCRDRAITDNNGNGDFKRRSVKKVKIKLYFINSQEMAGARVDTSHMFRVSDVKEKLNPDRFSHTGFKKTKTFELLKLNPTNNQYERVGQNYFSGTDATISQLDFFDKRLTVGNYKLTSKIQYSHPESNNCKHNYSPIRSTASPGHPVDNRCSVCPHGPGKHALLPDSSGKHHCYVCCQTLSNNNHLEWSDDAGEVNIEVYNDIPEIFSKDNTITEEQKVDTTTLYSMFDSVSDLQDTNIHYTDPNVNVLDQGCDSCGCGGDYAVLGNGAWNNNVYTETLAQKNVIDPFYQVNTGGIALNERLKGGEYSPGSFWGYPASSSITDGDQATASASSTLYVKPILYTSVKYKDLYFHTNETISQKDLLDNISAETGYARGTSVNDPVTKEIYSTNSLFVQATDNPNQTLNNMKWNIPLVRFEEGKICDGEGDKPSEAANCRKANSTEKEKVYEVSIKCTHPRSASLVYTESFKVHIVNDPPHAEAITEYDLHVGEEWTEEMFFKWWSCNAYDFEDGDKASTNIYDNKIPAKIEFLNPLDSGNRAYSSESVKMLHDLPNGDTAHNRYRINKSQNSIYFSITVFCPRQVVRVVSKKD